jgi:beta-galactosidase
MNSVRFSIAALGFALCLLPVNAAQYSNPGVEKIREVNSQREIFSLDYNWRFRPDNQQVGFDWLKAMSFGGPAAIDYPDSTWRIVDIPHDFVVEGTFTHTAPAFNGSLPGDIGLYRKTFEIPREYEGNRIWIEFDGVFRNSRIFLNGSFIGSHLSGYSSFRFDLTDFINYGGKNVLVVEADARNHEGWFYEGGGIYRHVRLVKTNPLHVAPWGVFVFSVAEKENLPKWADIHIRTRITNESENSVEYTLISKIFDPSGKKVTEKASKLRQATWDDQEFEQIIRVEYPSLWSIDTPNLYLVVSTILQGTKSMDAVETPFGIRTLRFDPDKGFFLNGRNIKLKGVCCHQDHAGVGAALPDRIHEFRIEKLKEMGCNAYRCSHNPPAPELLDACDRLGMLVMDENRIMESSPEILSQLKSLVLRDRNHPSIIMWSIGNEEDRVQGTAKGQRFASTMKRLVKSIDPFRPVTMAENALNKEGVSRVVDIKGFNYSPKAYDTYHTQKPLQPMVVSESASTVTTRGIYENDTAKGYLWAYDIQNPKVPWGLSAEVMWKGIDGRDYLMGCFVWTGFDYRGEPTPYSWPCINSHFGIMDTCGFPKDNYWYYQAWWSDKPVLHIFPHWNWPGKEGQEISVWCHSNCDQVELFLNDRSMGKKKVEKNTHLEWKVPYEPGRLLARGYKKTGETMETIVETTGAPFTINLTPDRTVIRADKNDVSMVTVDVRDEKNRIVPCADNEISFSIKGNAKIIGVGNGNPSSHEPDKATYRRVFQGLCQVVIQASDQEGDIELTAISPGLHPAHITIRSEKSRLKPSL